MFPLLGQVDNPLMTVILNIWENSPKQANGQELNGRKKFCLGLKGADDSLTPIIFHNISLNHWYSNHSRVRKLKG